MGWFGKRPYPSRRADREWYERLEPIGFEAAWNDPVASLVFPSGAIVRRRYRKLGGSPVEREIEVWYSWEAPSDTFVVPDPEVVVIPWLQIDEKVPSK